MANSATIVTVMGSTRCSAPTPATARTTMTASGPYATDVRASSDSADSPSTGVICSLDASRTRSGGPIRKRHADAVTPRLRVRRFGILCTVGEPSTSSSWRFIEEIAKDPLAVWF